MSTDEMVTFNTDELWDEMIQAGATQTELSVRIGMGKDYISKILRSGKAPQNIMNKIYKELGKGGFSNRTAHKLHKRVSYKSEKVSINGDRLTSEIQKKGYKKTDFAKELGVNPSTFCAWLSKDMMPADIVPKVKSLFGISADSDGQLGFDLVYEDGEHLYTEDDVRKIIWQVIDGLHDCVTDYLDSLRRCQDGSI